tara:strand:+ start:277 stop:831 length:555 start_codon:yes stop_codon:yes gene_type:complete
MDITNHYTGVNKIYYDALISNIINIGNLKNKNLILDYGCGEKRLEEKLNKKILNYDINPKYSDYESIDNLKYETVILNQVLMYLSPTEVKELFIKFFKINPNMEFIIGMGKQTLLSRIFAILGLPFSLRPQISHALFPHAGTKISYLEQKEFIYKYFDIIDQKKNIFFIADVFYIKFKKNCEIV